MFSATLTSRLSLKRVPRLRLDPTPVSSTRTALILHTTAGPSPYSTSTSNANETPLSALPPLPDQAEWRKVFNPPGGTVALRERACIRNPKSARALAEGFTQWTKPFLKADEAKGEGRGAKGAPRVIIKAFPGPGALTRALLTLPRDTFDKLIVLEEHPNYLDYLKPLEEVDDRVKVLPYNGYSWDTYTILEEEGWLDDVPRLAWDDGAHPSLQFITHVPQTAMGEQLVNQFLRCIPNKTWLFKYGGVPFDLIMGEWVWQRASADFTNPSRCKLSVIADATAELSSSIPLRKLSPHSEHFHPTVVRGTKVSKGSSREAGHWFVAANFLPHEHQAIGDGMLEKWDYCLRKLYVLKGQSLKVAIGSLGPGAQTLLKSLADPSLPLGERVDLKKQIRYLDIKDWALVLRAFDRWPFAPENLLIHDTYKPVHRENF